MISPLGAVYLASKGTRLSVVLLASKVATCSCQARNSFLLDLNRCGFFSGPGQRALGGRVINGDQHPIAVQIDQKWLAGALQRVRGQIVEHRVDERQRHRVVAGVYVILRQLMQRLVSINLTLAINRLDIRTEILNEDAVNGLHADFSGKYESVQ